MRPHPGAWFHDFVNACVWTLALVFVCAVAVVPPAQAAGAAGAPGAHEERLLAEPLARMSAGGFTAIAVTTYDGGHGARVVELRRAGARYALPRELNAALDAAGLDAGGDAFDEIARLLAVAAEPGFELEFGASRIESPAGGRAVRVLEATTRAGMRFEWRFHFGAGRRAGLLDRVEQRTVTSAGATTTRDVLLSPARPAAAALDIHGDVAVEFGYNILLTDLDGTSQGHQIIVDAYDIFDPGGAPAANVYAQITSYDEAYSPVFHGPVPVAIDATGFGTFTWSPPLGAPTGVAFVELGHLTSGVFTRDPSWPREAVFFEKARDLTYPGGTATQARVHYCEGFFAHHPLGTAHTETFVAEVLTGLTEAWQAQVVDWSLAQGHVANEPEDADGLHHVYVNDHHTDYRKPVAGGAGNSARLSGNDRLMWIRNEMFYNATSGAPYAAPLYTNESIRVRSAISHEFFHFVQSGWVNSLDVGPHALWIVEGQARAIPTLQYPGEEFLEPAQHLYPLDANRFLRREHDASFDSCTYEQALYWRFLFDRNQSGTTAQRAAVFRRVCQAMTGLTPAGGTDYLTPAVGAVDAALAADGGVFANFAQSRDSLAHTVWRRDYPHPNPLVMSLPAVEEDPDSNRVSLVWPGVAVQRDSTIHYPWGVDWWNFQMDPTVPLRRLHLSFDADPDRDGARSDFHLVLMVYDALGLRDRVGVIPRGLAFWDSTLEVRSSDSVVVIVHRVDMRQDAHAYRLRLSPPLAADAAHWDDIGAVLDGMGPRYRHDDVDEADLADPAFPWSSYDVLFLNCSAASAAAAPGARDSLREFVRRGGYLYVSDYDREYIEWAWPGAIQFGPKFGVIQEVSAQVTDPGLASVLHSTSATVEYDLNQWATVLAPGPATRVHLFGNYQIDDPGSAPPAAGFAGHSRGEAAISRPTRPEALVWRSGPLLLSFPDGEGRVIYTTFHNHAQLSEQQRTLLKYMIFQQTAGALLARTLEQISEDWHEWLATANGISPGESVTHELENPYNGILEVILDWGGSNLRLTARRPNGTVAGVIEGPSHPVRLTLPGAEAGTWAFEVTALDVPDSNYAYAIVVASPDARPGDPALQSPGESYACPGVTRVVTLPVANQAMYEDSFRVQASSDLGWTVAPADTVIRAWPGMSDSLRVRVTPPAGVTLGALDSLRIVLSSVLQPGKRDSAARAVRVNDAAPGLGPPAAATALPGADVPLYFTVTGLSGCADTYAFTLADSLGWTLYPPPAPIVVEPGAMAVIVGAHVPPGALAGASNPVTLTATRVAGGQAPVSAAVRVFVQDAAGVLLVDPTGGGALGGFVADALDTAGRAYTPWTGYGAPPAAVLAGFPTVIWLMGGAPLFPPDTTALGAYLRGGGHLLLSGQGMLASPFGADFAAAYGGCDMASDGGGTFAIRGHAGSPLGAIGPADIQGEGGAWNQYSPDELSLGAEASALLDYEGAPTTTGIAAAARNAGAWRMVTCGFGLEAIAPLAARAAILDALLEHLATGNVGVPPVTSGGWALRASPNPARAAVELRLAVPGAGRARLRVLDLQGRRVRDLLDGPVVAGERVLRWDGRDAAGRDLPPGVYLVALEVAGGPRLTRRIVRF